MKYEMLFSGYQICDSLEEAVEATKQLPLDGSFFNSVNFSIRTVSDEEIAMNEASRLQPMGVFGRPQPFPFTTIPRVNEPPIEATYGDPTTAPPSDDEYPTSDR